MRTFKLAIFLAALSLSSEYVTAQDFVDVIYLEDGSEPVGTIVARTSFPEETVTIETVDGGRVEVEMAEVNRISEERRDLEDHIGSGGEPTNSGDGEQGAEEEHRLGSRAFEVNLLGLLQFGPYLRYHAQIGDAVFLSPHVRLGVIGALPYLLWDDYAPSIGIGSGLLSYWPSAAPHGYFYAGAVVDLNLRIPDALAPDTIAVLANFGHRWRPRERSRYTQIGLLIGGTYDWWESYPFVLAMFELALGLEWTRG